MRRASSPQKTRALRLKEPLGVCTDRFCRIGRAKLHNAAGISAYTTHQHNRPRFHTAWVKSRTTHFEHMLSALPPIVLQKSQISGRQFSRQKTSQAVIAN